MKEANELILQQLDHGIMKKILSIGMKKILDQIGLSNSGSVVILNGYDDDLNEEAIINFYQDNTGYEAHKNEIRFRNSIFTGVKWIKLRILMTRMIILKNYLKNHYPDREFVIIGKLGLYDQDKKESQMRFHEKRTDEIPWLAENLDGFQLDALIVFQ